MITSEELEKFAKLRESNILNQDEFNVYLSDYCKKITLDKLEQIYILKEKNIVADNYFNKIKSDFIKDGKTGVFTLNKLEKFWDLKNKGIINKTEYDILKDKLMDNVTALLSAEELERLEALKNKGAITPEEFNDRKLGKNISRNPYKQKNPSVVSSLQIEELEKLAQLKNKGIITEDEFNAKKQEYLHGKSVGKIEELCKNITFSFKGILVIAVVIMVIWSIPDCANSNKSNKIYTSRSYSHIKDVSHLDGHEWHSANSSESKKCLEAIKKVSPLPIEPVVYDRFLANASYEIENINNCKLNTYTFFISVDSIKATQGYNSQIFSFYCIKNNKTGEYTAYIGDESELEGMGYLVSRARGNECERYDTVLDAMVKNVKDTRNKNYY